MRAAVPSILVSVFFLLPGSVASQPQPLRPSPGWGGEIIIYRDRNFDGPAVSIREDRANLGLAWTVSSARIRGGVWQVCERPRFQGPCLTLSASNSNLGRRRVQSIRLTRATGSWGVLGDTDVSRFGWDRRVIRVRGNQRLSEVRFCAERNRVRLRNVRALFANNRFQTLHVPLQLAAGRCTNILRLTNAPRNLSSVELSVSTLAVAARGRVRLEGR